MRLFNRNYALTIARFVGGRFETTALKLASRDEAGNVKSTLRIAFDITKTNKSDENTAKITVYNLNKEHRNLFQESKVSVLLEVGYENELNTIFFGNITRIYSEKSGDDWLTIMEASDGARAYQNATIDKAFAAGTNIKDIIKEVANTFKEAAGTDLGSFEAVKDEVAQNGITLEGCSKAVLEKLCKTQGLQMSIQDNELMIVPEGGTTDRKIINLTPESGLVGMPAKTLIKINNREVEGMQFKSLIQQNKLRPNRLVQIESQTVRGIYVITKAGYKGDTSAQDWYVICEGIEEKR